MLKVNLSDNTLSRLPLSSLEQSDIKERANLQRAIINSWEAFYEDLGYEDLFLIGQEIEPHDSCRDRIDILALDHNGVPVIFELKRGRDKLQLLQAITYASMIARWDKDRLLKLMPVDDNERTEELLAIVRDDAFSLQDPQIVLLAESYDPEVILAADWLSEYGVEISAFTISVVDHGGETLLSIDQRFPLPGLDDLYERRRKSRVVSASPDVSWDEALAKLNFPFAARAVEIFRRQKDGDPGRRRFTHMYADTGPGGPMGIMLRKNYLKIYSYDQSTEAKEALEAALGEGIPLDTWGSNKTRTSGYTFKVETEKQFEQFLIAVGEVR